MSSGEAGGQWWVMLQDTHGHHGIPGVLLSVSYTWNYGCKSSNLTLTANYNQQLTDEDVKSVGNVVRFQQFLHISISLFSISYGSVGALRTLTAVSLGSNYLFCVGLRQIVRRGVGVSAYQGRSSFATLSKQNPLSL